MKQPTPYLSDREIGLLRSLAEGRSNAEIAEELSLSRQTVKNYLSRLYGRLGVSTRAEAVRWAMEYGVLESNAQAVEEMADHTSDFQAEQSQTGLHYTKDAAMYRRVYHMPRSVLVAVLFIVALLAGGLWATTATYGYSTMSFPVSTGKVEAIETILRDKYGDDTKHWVELVKITYADGALREEPQAFFTFPTSFDPLLSMRLEDLPTGSRAISEGYTSIADTSQPLHVADLPDSPGLERMEETPFLYDYKSVYRFSALASEPVAMVGNYVYTYPDSTTAREALNWFGREILDGNARNEGAYTTGNKIGGELYHLNGSEDDQIYWFVGTRGAHLYLAIANGLEAESTKRALFDALAIPQEYSE